MSLVEELSQELATRAGLRVQKEWPSAIRAALAQWQGGAVLRPEHRDRLLFEVARCVTVPESHFFRNAAQLDYCVDFTDSVRRRERRRGQLWCAGSASGEEPYSLSMLLYRRLGDAFLEHFELVASDMNPEVVGRAETASYTPWAFRGAPEWCFPHFASEGNGRVRLHTAAVRRAVEFRVETCQEGASRRADESLDALLFRNVAIYLEQRAIAALYREFARILRPRGLLAIGTSDPWPATEAFQFVGCYDHAPVFVRRAPVEAPVEAPLTPSGTTTRELSNPLQLRLPFDPAPELVPDVDVEVEVDAELSAGEEFPRLTAEPSEADAQRVMGHAYLQQNDPLRAVAALRHAVFLEPSDELSRFFYGLALHESGDVRQAIRQLRNVVDSLSAKPNELLLSDGATRAGELLKSALGLEAQWK